MNVTLTNLGTIAVPVVHGSVTAGGGHLPVIEPGESFDIDDASITVVSVGNNPSFFEELAASVEGMVEAIKKLLLWWREREKAGTAAGVHTQIDNKGTNGLRVLLDSNLNEVTIEAGTTAVVEATNYVEIRELGV